MLSLVLSSVCQWLGLIVRSADDKMSGVGAPQSSDLIVSNLFFATLKGLGGQVFQVHGVANQML